MLVAGFGSVVVDTLMIADEIRANHKNRVVHQAIQVGGVIPTALIVLSRLGVKTQMHTTIGDDLFGEALLAIFQKEGVGLGTIIKIKNTETPLAFVVIHKKTGNRTSFYTTGSFPTTADHSFADVLKNKPQYLLVDGHNQDGTFSFIKKAKKTNTKVLLDLGSPKRGMDRLISEVDAVIVPQAFSSTMWPSQKPEEIIRNVLSSGPTLVVHTMEEKGCIVGQKNELLYQPSFTVKAVDTNGAGDFFFGSFTYGLLNQWTLKKTAEFAAAAAAFSCTKIGKDAKIPRSENEILTFIKTHTTAS